MTQNNQSWEEELKKIMSPMGGIVGLESQGNKLIIEFEANLPDFGSYNFVDGAAENRIYELIYNIRLKDKERLLEGLKELDSPDEADLWDTEGLMFDAGYKLGLKHVKHLINEYIWQQ